MKVKKLVFQIILFDITYYQLKFLILKTTDSYVVLVLELTRVDSWSILGEGTGFVLFVYDYKKKILYWQGEENSQLGMVQGGKHPGLHKQSNPSN